VYGASGWLCGRVIRGGISAVCAVASDV